VETEAGAPVPGTVEVSLLFCDLRHFTSYSNRHGDTAALMVLERLGTAVEESLGEAGRLVKALGDGYMLAYPDPDSAVASALAVGEAMGEHEDPTLHAGLHHGRAVFRDGDYSGRAVNLAARLLSIAQADELLATAGVVEGSPDRPWVSRGERTLFGFHRPIDVFALGLRGAA
jgi:adenylate cyclase